MDWIYTTLLKDPLRFTSKPLFIHTRLTLVVQTHSVASAHIKLKKMNFLVFNAKNLFTCHLGHFTRNISSWVLCEYLCLNVSLWYQVIQISAYMLCLAAVQRQLTRLTDKNLKFISKRKQWPSQFTCIAGSRRLTSTKPRKKREKDSRKVQKCIS